MKLREYWVVTVVIFIASAFLIGNVSAYDIAEYFPLNEGDEWTMLTTINGFSLPLKWVVNGTELVDEVETVKMDLGLPLLPVMGYNCFAIDHEGVKWYKGYNFTAGTVLVYDPPLIWSSLELGEVDETPYTEKHYSIDDGTLIRTETGIHRFSFKSVEDVTVPAGTFKDCLKIYEVFTELHDGGATEVIYHYTVWFARNVGWIKNHYWKSEDGKITEDGPAELISATIDGVHYGCPAIFALGGDAGANDINTLRQFRDEILSKTPAGQEIIRQYYELSPTIVKAMVEDEEFKKEVKEMIDGVMPMIRKLVE
jgi:hypothetical protein